MRKALVVAANCFAAAMSAASARAAIAAAGVLSLLALANEVADD